MRILLSMAAAALMTACASGASAPASAPSSPATASAAPASTNGTLRAIAGGSSTTGTSAETAKLVKGSPEAKAAGLRCERDKSLGSNRTIEICTTKAEREAAAKAGETSRDELRTYRGGQNIGQ